MASVMEPLMPHLGATSVRAAPPIDLVATARALAASHDDVVWLDSGSGGMHVLGTGSHRLLVRDGVATVDDEPVPGDALGALESARASMPGPWVGWLGYEAGVRALGLTPHASRMPEAAWLLLDRWIVVDDASGAVQVQSTTAQAWWPRLHGAGTVAPSPDGSLVRDRVSSTSVRWLDTDAEYLRRIERCIEHIREGDSYLLCLTTAIEAEPIDAVATHERLRASSGVHHGGLLRIAGTSLVSASPEEFLRVDDRRVITRPIKGTRPRGTGDDDAELDRSLRESEKERAENVMIVDLCRNDLQRVCEPGTVEVSSLLAIESYPTVHQLVSTVEGTLRPGLDVVDALRALFPAGSMTGAPKRRTVELLQAIEGRGRGVYSGCFGLLTASHADLAMVIRSIVADEHGTRIGVGGGITALSVPDEEVDEVHLKARALVAALVPTAAGDGSEARLR